MRMFFYLGLALLALSFVAAASENASYAMPGTTRTFFLPAHDLWYALWPKSLLVFEIKVQRLFGDWFWDPAMVTLLKLPAWLIVGGPGIALAVLCSPKRGQNSRAEMAEAEEALTLYDKLNERALSEIPPGEEHGPRDIMPEHAISDDEMIHTYGPDEHPQKPEEPAKD